MAPSSPTSLNNPDRRHKAVVGLQWGDEGKGKIVDLLTAQHDVIVRYNGGANAGHTVVVGDQRYALHLIPAGILYPQKLCVIANGVVVDPEVLITEIDTLRARGVEVGDNLCLSDRAHVVMPYHKQHDAALARVLSSKAGGGRGQPLHRHDETRHRTRIRRQGAPIDRNSSMRPAGN